MNGHGVRAVIDLPRHRGPVSDLPIQTVAVMCTIFGVFGVKTCDLIVEWSRRWWDDRQKARLKCQEAAVALVRAALPVAEGREAVRSAMYSAVCELRIYGASRLLLDAADEVLAVFSPELSGETASRARLATTNVPVIGDRAVAAVVHDFAEVARRELQASVYGREVRDSSK